MIAGAMTLSKEIAPQSSKFQLKVNMVELFIYMSDDFEEFVKLLWA
jgi:hypothetical protein